MKDLGESNTTITSSTIAGNVSVDNDASIEKQMSIVIGNNGIIESNGSSHEVLSHNHHSTNHNNNINSMDTASINSTTTTDTIIIDNGSSKVTPVCKLTPRPMAPFR